MLKGLTLSLLVVFAVPAFAGPKHFYTDKKWWIGVAVIGAANALDALSTCQSAGRGIETNPILGPNPSCKNVAGLTIGGFVIESGFHALSWHCQQDDFFEQHPAGQKGRCYGLNQYEGNHPILNQVLVYSAIPAINVGFHIPAAIHNWGLPKPAAVTNGLVQ